MNGNIPSTTSATRLPTRDGKAVPSRWTTSSSTVRTRASSSPSSAPRAAARRPACAWPQGWSSRPPARVRVGGKEVTAPGPDRAVVFQQFALFPWKTVRENIDFGLRCQASPRAKKRRAHRAYLRLMNLEGYEDGLPAPALGRHAAARGDRARLCARPRGAADGRALRRARRADPHGDAGRTGAPGARATRAPCCSSPMPWKRPSIWPTASW